VEYLVGARRLQQEELQVEAEQDKKVQDHLHLVLLEQVAVEQDKEVHL
jgi:hypothetical protein